MGVERRADRAVATGWNPIYSGRAGSTACCNTPTPCRCGVRGGYHWPLEGVVCRSTTRHRGTSPGSLCCRCRHSTNLGPVDEPTGNGGFVTLGNRLTHYWKQGG